MQYTQKDILMEGKKHLTLGKKNKMRLSIRNLSFFFLHFVLTKKMGAEFSTKQYLTKTQKL